MSHTANKPTVAAMLHEAQNYRTSLESLMSVGRALLDNPSMEDASATAFQVLAENVLEQADHQQDLVAVEGVEEPQVKVELIMQDVLTPRLTEVEEIEEALQAKADADEPVPFHTSERATHTSQEELVLSLESLAIHHNYISAIGAVLSMESFPVEAARTLTRSITQCFGGYVAQLGVSMESVEQTQVLGEMSDAVDRIEQLVSKAHEAVLEQAEAIRADAQSVGSDEADKLGDLIEKHRQDNPVGIQFEEGTAVNNINSDATLTGETEEEVGHQEENLDNTSNDDDMGMTADETELVVVEEENESPDVENEEQEQEEEETDPEEEETPDEVGDTVEEELTNDDPDDNASGDDLDNDVEEEANADTIDPDAVSETNTDTEEEQEEETEPEEEEEEDGENNSNESYVEPLVWDADVYGDQASEVRGIHTRLLQFLGDHGMLTPEGQALVEADQASDFVLSTDLMTPHAGEVLARHYSTWMAAALRDGEPNLMSLAILLGV